MRTRVADPFTDDQVHRIMLEHYFFFTIDEVCAKWKITRYRLRKWKKTRATWRHFWRVEDCLIAAIHRGGEHEAKRFIEWLDYRNHARYSPAEIEVMFETLEAEGQMVRQGHKWSYVQVDPPYIFGPRPEELT